MMDFADHDEEAVYQRMRRLLSHHLYVSSEAVTPDARTVDHLGADSLDLIELVIAVEEEFGIDVPNEAAENLGNCSVREMVEYVSRKIKT